MTKLTVDQIKHKIYCGLVAFKAKGSCPEYAHEKEAILGVIAIMEMLLEWIESEEKKEQSE